MFSFNNRCFPSIIFREAVLSCRSVMEFGHYASLALTVWLFLCLSCLVLLCTHLLFGCSSKGVFLNELALDFL